MGGQMAKGFLRSLRMEIDFKVFSCGSATIFLPHHFTNLSIVLAWDVFFPALTALVQGVPLKTAKLLSFLVIIKLACIDSIQNI